MEKRTQLQRVILLLLAFMIVLFGILNVRSMTRRGVVFEGALLSRTETAETVTYSGQAHGEPVEITVTSDPDGSRTEVVFRVGERIRDACVVETEPLSDSSESSGGAEGLRVTKNGVTLFEGTRGPDSQSGGYNLYDLNGQWVSAVGIEIRAFSENQGYWDSYETSIGRILTFADGPELTHRGSMGLYLVMVVLTLVVMLDAAYPMTLFWLHHACDVRDPEPSDFYLFAQKIGWVFSSVLLLGGYLYALLWFP